MIHNGDIKEVGVNDLSEKSVGGCVWKILAGEVRSGVSSKIARRSKCTRKIRRNQLFGMTKSCH